MHCQHCNERLPLSARTCFNCGAPVTRNAPPPVQPPPADVPPPLPSRARIAAATALRDRPYGSARQIMSVPAGQTAAVLGEQWGFVHLELADGRRGFVERAAVAPETAAEPQFTSGPSASGRAASPAGHTAAAAAGQGTTTGARPVPTTSTTPTAPTGTTFTRPVTPSQPTDGDPISAREAAP